MTGCQGCLTHSTKKDMFLVVFGVFIASSLVAGVIGWDVNRSDDSDALSPLETSILDLSTTWCQSVMMESSSTPSRLFVYADEPPLNAHVESSVEEETNLEPGGYKYVEWNLKQGSYINLTACCENPLSFFVFEGNKFNDWVSNGYSPDAGSAGASFVFHYPGGCPDNQVPPDFFQYSIDTSNSYYFVFANYNTTTSASVNWTLFADRIEYNVNASTTQLRCNCTASPSCSCPLHYTKSNSIIVEAGWADEWHDVSLTWNCAPRLWINIIVFTVVGLTPPALAAVCMWWCWSGIQKQIRDNESDVKAIGLLERASSESDEEYEKKRY